MLFYEVVGAWYSGLLSIEVNGRTVESGFYYIVV